jgi:hypothetical protein
VVSTGKDADNQIEDLEQLVLSRSPRFRALLNKSRQSIKAGKGLPRDEFWQAVEERSAKLPPDNATAANAENQ